MSEQDTNVDDNTPNVVVDDTLVSDTQNDNTQDDSANDSDDVQKLKEQNKKLFERAKKAEGFVKDEGGNWVKKPKPAPTPVQSPATQTQVKDDGLTPKDLYALMDAKVPQADVDEVVRAAKLLGKSIPEALNDGLVKARLKDLAEQRETSNATNTTGSKRTTVKLSDEGLVEKALKGGDVDPEALALARINLKKAKK